jgi:RNA polymerase sigma-70 factor (ECF subfamily)
MELATNYKTKQIKPTLGIERRTESELIRSVASGNRSAQKELYQKYFGKMSGVAIRYTSTKEEAYEVLNDAFMNVFKSIKTYKGTGQLSAWIYKIVLNTTYAYARKNYKVSEIKTELKAKDITVANEAISNMGLAEIYKSIQKLPDSHRLVFSMYVLDNLKHKEIAKELKISEGTSKWYLSSARIKLQELLKEA